ncbi:hypothetical protein HHK36_026953 [Tetracentron sinense]|uniref:Pre-mRNA-processing factor 39 n=1 Tax=Tetracentron sinense TaxID=13715 RepID=A0A834YGI5_TETSI|nr:hypothetical protein HHK36_026953 [Tetracentron sinense]
MGDSETVVAQTSAVMDYTSTDYTSLDYTDASSNAVPVVGTLAPEATEDSIASAIPTDVPYAVPDGSCLGDGITYTTDPNSVVQEAPVISIYEAKPVVGVTDTSENVVSQDYDSYVNGNGVIEVKNFPETVNGEIGNASNDAGGAAAEQQFGDGSAISTEEDRLWSIVGANSLDFNSWTALIEETEKVAEDTILKIQKVYDAFLAEFPLCYGYWKKYADHEARLGSIDKVVEVYERAVQAVTYSVDIWLHYCVFAISTYGDPDTSRRLFERGLAYVGTDYLSYPLWDKYIEYEYAQQNWCHLAMIYTRILENPIQQLDHYFNSFKELAGSRPLSELRTAEEAAAMVATNLEASGQGVEGEVHSDSMEQSLKPVIAGLTEAEELENYIAIREEMYKKAKEFESKIIGFEAAIRRPYFHVRPLNGAELDNWHSYLDFIERGDDFNKVSSYLPNNLSVRQGGSLLSYLRGLPVPPMEYFLCVSLCCSVVKLYERCLIACANYPEYWIRYVLCMEASGSMDLANNALARATQVFVKRQPEIHLFAGRFKEQNGDISGARAAYQFVHTAISPGLLEAIIKHANMEHRLGNLEDAFSLYEQSIATEKVKGQSQTLSMLFVQYSRFSYLVGGTYVKKKDVELVASNAEKAKEILVEALEHVQLSKPILEALIHLELIQSVPKRIEYLDSLVDKFVVPNPDNFNAAITADREELSSIFLEFLDLFGDTQTIKKAYDRHAKLFLCHRSTSELKKRQAEEFLASDKAKLAKSYVGAVPSPTQSVMGAYPSAQNQWVAGYGLQPQAWPQATQAQGQQGNPGYAQQAGHSGYGSSYTHPQIPTSTSPTAAYGVYPPTYPVQAFPQQNYVQPAPAAAFPPAQQPAPVPQAYYGSYY